MSASQRKDITGKAFGFLTAVRFAHSSKQGTFWLFDCQCGGRRTLPAKSVVSGNTTSCGCMAHSGMLSHGGTVGEIRSPEYTCWVAMRRRCTYPRDKGYPLYGGRGVRVCDRWLKSFPNFLADMGPRPTLGHSLDRIDSDGDYEPGNVRWATPGEQARNRSVNRMLTLGSETLCLADWATRLGWSQSGLRKRVAALGAEAALVSRDNCGGRGRAIRLEGGK